MLNGVYTDASELINTPEIEEYAKSASRLFGRDATTEKILLNREFNESDILVKNITLQVTEDCNLACSYCYQHNKTQHSMDIKTAKAAIDAIINDKDLLNKIAIVLEFIGGEPFLKIDLISEITEYYFSEMVKVNPKLASRTRISICSNGTLYNTKKVQDYIQKYKHFLSFTISIDGNKELHDKCRVFKNTGEPTYDIAIKSAMHYRENYGYISTKMTFAKENLSYIYDGIINMYNVGYRDIHCNCAFEPEWNLEDAKLFYSEFKKVADWLLEDKRYLRYSNSMFSEMIGEPIPIESKAANQNYCGGNGQMLAVGHDGTWYPCLRFMPSSIGDSQLPITAGDIFNGIDHEVLKEMQKVTLLSQSTEECINCPVAAGCSWCTAYNYETYGTINKRVTNICWMHKARSLINTYFYNKIYIELGDTKRLKVFLPEKDALQIISKEEYDMLKNLSCDRQQEENNVNNQ